MRVPQSRPSLPFSVMFHHFRGPGHGPAQGAWTEADLGRFLRRERPHLLSAEVWLERFRTQTLRPGEFCLSFDDGLRCQFDLALPVLEAFGIKAFWFVQTAPLLSGTDTFEVFRHFRNSRFASPTRFYDAFFTEAAESGVPNLLERVRSEMPSGYLSEHSFYDLADREFRFARDRVLKDEQYENVMRAMMARRAHSPIQPRLWMRPEQLRTLADRGHLIGLHSHTHPTRLAALSLAQQRDEYEINRRELEQMIGSPPNAMAHPSNSYGDETLEILRDLGIEVGFRSDAAEPAQPGNLTLPRWDAAAALRTL